MRQNVSCLKLKFHINYFLPIVTIFVHLWTITAEYFPVTVEIAAVYPYSTSGCFEFPIVIIYLKERTISEAN